MEATLPVRNALGVAELDGKMYAVGGNNDSLSSMECFDPSTGVWSAVAAAMDIARSYVAVAALECPE